MEQSLAHYKFYTHRFNAVASHHQLTLVNNHSKNFRYESGLFNNFLVSKPSKFNDNGTFAYSGPSFDNGGPNHKINVTLVVVKKLLTTTFNTTAVACTTNKTTSSPASTNNNNDAISAIVTPAKLLDKVDLDLKSQGFGIVLSKSIILQLSKM